jgi:hypothetical protein
LNRALKLYGVKVTGSHQVLVILGQLGVLSDLDAVLEQPST